MATVIFLTETEEKALYDIGILGAANDILLVTPKAFAEIKANYGNCPFYGLGDTEIQDIFYQSNTAEDYCCAGSEWNKAIDIIHSANDPFVEDVLDELVVDED